LADEVVTRYIELGLRLGRLLDGFVDAYYGPPELKQRVDNEPIPEPVRLLADARRLLADLDAGEGDLDAHRRRWLRGQARGLLVTARRFAGESIGFLDEVEECYGVRPTRVEDDEIAAAHRRIDAVLPGTGSLSERLITWREAQAIPPEKYPRILFIWGLTRILPVTIDSMTISELEYDALLNPLRAEVDISLSVIAVDQCSDDDLAKGALDYTTIAKEAQAIANLANTAEQIVDLIPL
jgi:hypothetical protein